MTLQKQLVCTLGALICFLMLITVRESNSSFVPGRCLCPATQQWVRGRPKDLTVLPKSPSCNRITVIVTLKNNDQVCLNPNAPLGKHLAHCWNRANKLNRDTKNCLKWRRRGPRTQRRSRNHRNKASSQTT